MQINLIRFFQADGQHVARCAMQYVVGGRTQQQGEAVAAPGLEGEQVLLGMSALNKLEFTQRGGTMLLRQTTN